MAISLAQPMASGFTPSGATLPATFGAATTTGNTLVAVAQPVNANSMAISSFAINNGAAVFTKKASIAPNSANTIFDIEIWVAPNITGGAAPTVTLTANQTLAWGELFVFELAGMPSTAQLDGTPAGASPAANTTMSTPAITTLNYDDIIFAAFSYNNGNTPTIQSGWTLGGAGGYFSFQYLLTNTPQNALVSTMVQSPSAIYNSLICALTGSDAPFETPNPRLFAL